MSVSKIEKRIAKLEQVSDRRNVDGAWIAFINPDETVNLSHIKHDDIFLSSREQLHEFIKLHDLQGFDLIIVDHTTCKGAKPIEL